MPLGVIPLDGAPAFKPPDNQIYSDPNRRAVSFQVHLEYS